jgi:hypothetical protein
MMLFVAIILGLMALVAAATFGVLAKAAQMSGERDRGLLAFWLAVPLVLMGCSLVVLL